MIETEFIYRATIAIGPVQEIGNTQAGHRRIIPITGGAFDGPGLDGKALAGEILPGGADWQVARPDGTAFVEARYTMRTAAGALIYVQNAGYRHGPPDVMARLAAGDAVDPDSYYFRTMPQFETADAGLSWLTRTVCVAKGARHADRVVLDVFAVL